jgi:arginine repressor
VDVQSGDLVIFPGFMKHGTEVSQSDLPRDIISFNFAKVNRKPKEILYK